MRNLRRFLALAMLAALPACGGGGGSSAGSALAPAAPSAPKVPTRVADAKGTITLRFPAHVAVATSAKSASSKKRSPAYINPTNTNLLFFTAFGSPIYDPANPANDFFTLSEGTANPDGSITLNVPLFSGTYNQNNLQVTEEDAGGDDLSYGFNSSYTDANNNYQSGVFTLAPGGTAAPVLTMTMNATGIAITEDPVAGTGSQMLSQNSGSPTCYDANPGQTVYFYGTDPTNTFVVTGTSGYTGGDQNNNSPGLPTVTLSSFSSIGGPPNSRLIQSNGLLNGYLFSSPGGFDVLATVYLYNPVGQSGFPGPPYVPFGYPYQVNGYVEIGPGCG